MYPKEDCFYSEETYEALKNLMFELDKEPDRKEVLMNEVTQTSFIPIDILEGMLDKWTMGQYSIKNFEYKYGATKVTGSVELEYYHPITGNLLTRTGAAAVLIEKKVLSTGKDTTVTLDVELAQPALLSMCTISAIRKIGRCFGRSLNREIVDILDNQNNSTEFQNAISELNSMSSIKEINDSKVGLIEKYSTILTEREIAVLSDTITKKVIELMKHG